MPRHVFRGTPDAYASGDRALSIAVDAIARGIDQQVRLEGQMFFYLPIMHQENLLAQVAYLGLYQRMLARAEKGTEIMDNLTGLC